MPEQSFWAQRWEKNELGFHELEINAHLKKYIHALCPNAEKKVLVPLCGKTLDLLFLSTHFGEVWGIEYIESAAIDFFRENKMEPSIEDIGCGKLYQCANIHLVVADIFAFLDETSMCFDALYDRAALIAMEKDKRNRYAQLLRTRLDEHATILVVALNYPQEEMDGPPFSVAPDEIQGHFETDKGLKLLEDQDILDPQSRWRQRGVTRMRETVFVKEVS
ncbi:MAG: thiopurine S-methyltransferase [Myxococcota bacterium]|nr:thiopurine S-methyltransferase [Myxococcota bacterium]